VPRLAASKRPLFWLSAPVKAPFSWPKSSLSSSSRGIAPQLTVRRDSDALGLALWIARARSSLPVPDSPSMSTGTSCLAAISALAIRFRIETLRCRMSSNAAESGGSALAESSISRERLTKSGMNSAAISNGSFASVSPCSSDVWMSRPGCRVLASRIQTTAMLGVPGLRWNVSSHRPSEATWASTGVTA